MLNDVKIRLMTQLSLFEKQHKKDIELTRFYQSDYIRLQIVKSIVAATAGFLLVGGLVLLYNLEYIIEEAVRIPYQEWGYRILACYFVSLAVYGLISAIIAVVRLHRAQVRLQGYRKNLRRLRQMYQEELQNQGKGGKS
ncbi:MAG: hypothetical protein PUB10_05040 [Clostridiales bacterium]|nr:hypothetical protein [Clostridiales bacterium]